MEFGEMVAKKQEMLQRKIDQKSKILWELAGPITSVLKDYKLRFKTQVHCHKPTRIPHIVSINVKRPEIEIEVRESGYTLREDDSPWSYLNMSDITLELALEHLAAIVAKAQVRSPCR